MELQSWESYWCVASPVAIVVMLLFLIRRRRATGQDFGIFDVMWQSVFIVAPLAVALVFLLHAIFLWVVHTVDYLGLAALLVITLVAWLLAFGAEDYMVSRMCFAALLISAALSGVLFVIILERRFPETYESLDTFAKFFFKYYLYGAILWLIFLPENIARALYRVLYAQDLTVKHSRASWIPHMFKCSRCGASLPSPVSKCPRCGIGLVGSSGVYAQTVSSTSLAFALLLMLALNVLYGIMLYEVWQQINWSDYRSIFIYGGGLIVNLIVLAIAAFKMYHYQLSAGTIQKYY